MIKLSEAAPAEIEVAIATALTRITAELGEVAQAACRVGSGGCAVNQSQIIASFVRAATWQLMRRSPTWLLLAIVVGAWLMAGHR